MIFFLKLLDMVFYVTTSPSNCPIANIIKLIYSHNHTNWNICFWVLTFKSHFSLLLQRQYGLLPNLKHWLLMNYLPILLKYSLDKTYITITVLCVTFYINVILPHFTRSKLKSKILFCKLNFVLQFRIILFIKLIQV